MAVLLCCWYEWVKEINRSQESCVFLPQGVRHSEWNLPLYSPTWIPIQYDYFPNNWIGFLLLSTKGPLSVIFTELNTWYHRLAKSEFGILGRSQSTPLQRKGVRWIYNPRQNESIMRNRMQHNNLFILYCQEHLSCVRNVHNPLLCGLRWNDLIITIQILPLQELQGSSQFWAVTDVEAVICCKHQHQGVDSIQDTATDDGLVLCYHVVSSCQGRTPLRYTKEKVTKHL